MRINSRVRYLVALRTCPTRTSYLESLIDGVFAPPRARRPAGLKRRATNNEPRKFVPADGTILHATHRGERTPDRSGRYEADHAHVRESCNVLMRPAIFFSCDFFAAVASGEACHSLKRAKMLSFLYNYNFARKSDGSK